MQQKSTTYINQNTRFKNWFIKHRFGNNVYRILLQDKEIAQVSEFPKNCNISIKFTSRQVLYLQFNFDFWEKCHFKW